MENTGMTSEARDLREKMESMKRDLSDMARTTTNRVVTNTKQWAQDNPGATLAIVAGASALIGFTLGMLLARNRD